jgi:hypothetical protein
MAVLGLKKGSDMNTGSGPISGDGNKEYVIFWYPTQIETLHLGDRQMKVLVW